MELSEGPEAKWSHIAEFPFDSDVKKMSALFQDAHSQEAHIFTKVSIWGTAPAIALPPC